LSATQEAASDPMAQLMGRNCLERVVNTVIRFPTTKFPEDASWRTTV
jgi:hypothetical protein